jgi:hypothetical protein
LACIAAVDRKLEILQLLLETAFIGQRQGRLRRGAQLRPPDRRDRRRLPLSVSDRLDITGARPPGALRRPDMSGLGPEVRLAQARPYVVQMAAYLPFSAFT